MTWPPQSPNLNPVEMVWDELDLRIKEKQPASAQHLWELLQDCWKTVPGDYPITLIERIELAKLSSKRKVATLRNLNDKTDSGLTLVLFPT